MGVIRQEGTGPHPDAPSLRPSGSWGPTDKAMMPPEYLERMSMPTTPMTENEIADVIAAYGRSAANAQAAGFDGIAIHGRSEERRVGKGCVSTCRSRGLPYP